MGAQPTRKRASFEAIDCVGEQWAGIVLHAGRRESRADLRARGDDPAPIQRHNHAFPNVSYLSHIHLVM